MSTDSAENASDLWSWLIDQADPIVADLAGVSSPMDYFNALRQRYGAVKANLVIDQAMLRKRSFGRFPPGSVWWWTETLLQQASDWATALYKASRFPIDVTVVDGCCGAGADFVALAARGPVVGIDLDPTAVRLANANLHAQGFDDESEAVIGDVLTDYLGVKTDDSWFHVDPDRRPGGNRVTHGDWMEPSLGDLLPLIAQTAGGCVKLAPATRIVPEELMGAPNQSFQRQWISHAGQCRQQVLWWGPLVDQPHYNIATRVSWNSAWTSEGELLASVPLTERFGGIESVEFRGDPTTICDGVEEPQEFIYDLDPAVRAAGLTEAFADAHQLCALGSAAGYLTGDQPCSHLLAENYRVVQWWPWHEKKVRQALSSLGPARYTVKKRQFEIDANLLARQLNDKLMDKSIPPAQVVDRILAMTTIGKRRIAMLVERME